MLLKIALRHPTMESCLADLRPKADLRRLIAIESQEKVPHLWNMSPFEEVLGQEPFRTYVKEIFDEMIRRLGTVVPFGSGR